MIPIQRTTQDADYPRYSLSPEDEAPTRMLERLKPNMLDTVPSVAMSSSNIISFKHPIDSLPVLQHLPPFWTLLLSRFCFFLTREKWFLFSFSTFTYSKLTGIF